MMELRTVKGTRDFLPEDKILRDKFITMLKSVFEQYGYNPLETPALEMQETLASKYAGGAEILKEVFTLKDNADRDLGLRYDLTVPFARVVAMNPQLKKPFKRYQIDRVWRNGPIKLGRYREFYQCDADVVGIHGMGAEAELLSMIEEFFKKISLNIVIKVNNRKVLDALMKYASIEESMVSQVILTLDKLKKIGIVEVEKELDTLGIALKSRQKLLSLCKDNEQSLDQVEAILGKNEGLDQVREVLRLAKLFGVTCAEFDLTLARGLSYYTGTIWEVYAKDGTIQSSIGAGGRYDNIIGMFTTRNEPMPAVGTSFGLDVILDVYKAKTKEKIVSSVTQVLVIPIQTFDQSIAVTLKIRQAGINADIDMLGRPLSKNLDFAGKYGIPFVVIVGENEIAQQSVMLRNLQTGKQEQCTLTQAIKIMKKDLFK